MAFMQGAVNGAMIGAAKISLAIMSEHVADDDPELLCVRLA